MKKSFLIAAMAGLAFVGCTESELDSSVKSQEAIRFNAPVVKPNTKVATEIGSVYGTDQTFRVWGHYYTNDYTNFGAGQLYINEAECTNSGNTWIPNNATGTYYWPKNGTLTFIAYHPSTPELAEKTVVGANGLTITDYTVKQPNSEMEDLMFSERAYNMKKSSQGDSTGVYSPYDGVDLQFRHALASIAFNAKLNKEYPGTIVRIKGISLSNVVSKATFKQNLTDANGITTKTEKLSSGTSTVNASWTPSSTRIDYVVDLTPTNLTTTAFWPCTNNTTAPVTTGVFNTRNTDLILIPQNVDNVTLRIDYSIESPDSDPIDQYYEVKLADSWKMGYRYVYNVTFGFDPITFAPTVEVFVDADGNIAI